MSSLVPKTHPVWERLRAPWWAGRDTSIPVARLTGMVTRALCAKLNQSHGWYGNTF